jgi:molybdate transport system substrate-binding protein
MALKVLSTNGVAAALAELAPEYERASGERLTLSFGAAKMLRERIEAGEDFDVALLTRPVAEDLATAGMLASASRVDLARSGVGIAVRAGAKKPDIGTTEAFKRTLLAARSIVYSTQGASGIYFAGLVERLGIAAEIAPKAKRRDGGDVAVLVARGEAELAVQQISELLPVAGTDLVGPLPPELQSYTVFTGAVGSRTKEPQAAQALLAFLATPAARAVYRAKGLEST